MAELLRQYAAKQAFTVRAQPGSVEINCEDDLWRHYARDPGWMGHYLTLDNSTCINPIPPDAVLGSPGWGGAYKGSKVRCVASHDQRTIAQPYACTDERGMMAFQPGTSFQPFDAFLSAHLKDR